MPLYITFGGDLVQVPAAGADTVTELTGNDTLSAGVEYYQSGDSSLTHTLPGATRGARFRLYKYGEGAVRLNRAGTDIIEGGFTYIENTTIGRGFIDLYCYVAGEWERRIVKGVWDSG